MTGASRLLRGTLPFLAALSVATAFGLPASARQPAPAARTAAPTRAAQWWLTAMDVSRAWRSEPARGDGVTIAVLSTGVEAAHQDLAGAVTAAGDAYVMTVSVTRVPGRSSSRCAALPPLTAMATNPALSG